MSSFVVRFEWKSLVHHCINLGIMRKYYIELINEGIGYSVTFRFRGYNLCKITYFRHFAYCFPYCTSPPNLGSMNIYETANNKALNKIYYLKIKCCRLIAGGFILGKRISIWLNICKLT